MEKKLEFRALKANEVEARIGTMKEGKGFSLLLYKDARVDMQLLDETVGADRWQRKHELIAGNLYCSVGIKFNDEWVWKQDVGTESNTEKEKGQASDAFKRACFNWGIGRELYTAPFIWIKIENVKDFSKYMKFKVTKMQVKNGSITELEITDDKGNILFPEPKKPVIRAEESQVSQRTISALDAAKKALEACKTREEIRSVWNANPALKEDKEWTSFVTNYGNSLNV